MLAIWIINLGIVPIKSADKITHSGYFKFL